MELSQIITHIEALVFASDKPLTAIDILELINNAFAFMEERITHEQVEAALNGIQEKYNAEFYPFTVKVSGGGYQFLTKKDFHQTVAQLNGDKFLKRLSNAALETLAIIAYKQPITKGEVEAIRGVNSDYSVQKLLEKELIIISGRNEDLPGKPLVYNTSKAFMDYFGINSTDDLPKIKEILAEQTIQGTLIHDAINAHVHSENDMENTLAVGDNGELIVQSLENNKEAETGTKLSSATENIATGNETPALTPEIISHTTDETNTPAESSGDSNEIDDLPHETKEED